MSWKCCYYSWGRCYVGDSLRPTRLEDYLLAQKHNDDINPPRRIQFPPTPPLPNSEDELKALANACARATFGLNQEDVLDETYRKARAMDAEHFAMNFNPASSGLLEHVKNRFFYLESGVNDNGPRRVRAELYKLNVYGSCYLLPFMLRPECIQSMSCSAF